MISSRINSKSTIATILLAFAVPGSLARGADLLPASRVDASGTGTVPVAAPMKAGFSKFTIHGESYPYETAADVRKGNGIDRMNRFDALAGTSIVKGLDLHLGVHGTYEREGEISSRRVSAGSLMLKTNIISASGFNLALAPWLESGIGVKGKEVETRAVRARGGVMLLTGWNRKNAFEWNLALGNRNRATEEFEGLRFGHESIYKTSFKVNLTNDFGLTAAADGRQIRVIRDESAGESIFGTGRGQAGFFARFGNVETSIYGGASIDRALGKKYWKPSKDIADIDGGRLFFGAAVSLSLGKSASSTDGEPARDFENNAVDYQVRAKQKGAGNAVGMEPAKAGDAAQPVSHDNDFLKDFGSYSGAKTGADDFSAAEASVKKRDSIPAGAYDITAVEREIKQLRETEKKAQEARQKAEEARLEKERREKAMDGVAREKQMRRMRKEVQSEVDALPTITTEDMSWRGIE